MSLKTVVGVGAVVAAAGAVVSANLPELQRYLKVRKM
jgi:hypothetical protein